MDSFSFLHPVNDLVALLCVEKNFFLLLYLSTDCDVSIQARPYYLTSNFDQHRRRLPLPLTSLTRSYSHLPFSCTKPHFRRAA